MVPNPSNGDLTYQYTHTWSGPLPTHGQEEHALQFQDLYSNSTGGSSFDSSQYGFDSNPSSNANNAFTGSLTASPSSAT